MADEQDLPPLNNSWRAYVRNWAQGLQYLRAFWGRRFIGTAFGLMADAISAAATQSFYAQLPGHRQQAPDSLRQTGLDRALVQFRGESLTAFALRQSQAWDDYAQGGTWQQIIKVVNQWGRAGWPSTWVNLAQSNLAESAHTSFTFTLTIPFGNITPPWTPVLYGSSDTYGENGFFYGVGPSNDIPMLLYLVRKWKPSRSKAFVTVYYDKTHAITFTVG